MSAWVEAQGTEAKTQIPDDAEAWELYSTKRGVHRVAKALTRALRRALKANTRERAISIMKDALVDYDDFGADDTEPRSIAERCLTQGRGGNYRWSL